MQAISLIGYKKSGKTTLGVALAKIFSERGIRVGVLKYTNHHFALSEDTDTSKYAKYSQIVAGISPSQTLINLQKTSSFQDILPQFHNIDLLIIEGGKTLTASPRIILTDNMEDLNALKPHIAIASYGEKELPAQENIPHCINPEKLADLILEKAFIIPAFDCGACGCANCESFIESVLQNKNTWEKCKIKNSSLKITTNGMPLDINPFVENIISETIKGLLKTLKGYTDGEITIKIK